MTLEDRSRGSLVGAEMTPLSAACGLQCEGSVVVAHRISCSPACGIFQDQRSNPCPLHWEHGVLTTEPPGRNEGNLSPGNLDWL